MNRQTSFWLPPFLLILLTLVFFSRLAFTDLILARGDTFVYFYPYWHVRDLALSAGELPLWTPNIYMGAPLFANPQIGTLYPPNWLTMGLPAPQSVKISVLLHVTWVMIGVYAMARVLLRVQVGPALVAAVCFGFGGYIAGHVEQINQLQGLAWMPWLFVLWQRSRTRPRVFIPLFAMAWAMQLLSGHTQTTFISGVGLGLYVLGDAYFEAGIQQWRRWFWLLLPILLSALLGVLLALPQLIPTQELISLSNRGGGLSTQEATAFSLNPLLLGRALLPAYEGQLFAEYLGYVGVVGLVLAILGALRGDRWRRVWLLLALLGLLLALGRFTPLYLLLANFPGFDLFRVPARWLGLFALAASMLAALGADWLLMRTQDKGEGGVSWRLPGAVMLIIGLLAALTLLSDRAADEIDGQAIPGVLSWLLWAAAACWVLGLLLMRHALGVRWTLSLLLAGLCLELIIAGRNLPLNDLVDPAVYDEGRFAVNQMRVFNQDEAVPGRFLGISELVFDPGDKAALEARWQEMGLGERATTYAFTATKLAEVLAPNLPLIWDIASTDGAGGGVLPTAYYTAFTSLMIPEGTPRSIDGRLREVLDQRECRGACIPEDRWLDLTHTRYLLIDKVFDLVHEGIFYDTGLIFPAEAEVENPTSFEADSLHLLCLCSAAPRVAFVSDDGLIMELMLQAQTLDLDGLRRFVYLAEAPGVPYAIQVEAAQDDMMRALTLVDSRSADFAQLTPPGWQRIYSADVKIYENLDVMPRAFLVSEVVAFADNSEGTEAALLAMRDPAFNPRTTAVLNTDETNYAIPELPITAGSGPQVTVEILSYEATRVVVQVDTPNAAWLILTDAYYPGWKVHDQQGQLLPLVRANVMFRGVKVAPGEQILTFEFEPETVGTGWFVLGAMSWLLALVFVAAGQRRSTRQAE